MFRKSWLVLLCLCVGLPTFAQATAPSYEVLDCPFYISNEDEVEGETFDCGVLTVPESRTAADSPTIELWVMTIYSTSDNPLEPVIYLEGGPGGAALSAYDSWFPTRLREQHDLILLEQRGTGYSLPSLDCPEVTGEEGETLALIQECRDRLANEGINLAAYTSAENAQDVADLIVALDLEQVNLYGVSYGTRLALTVMRDRPERIRSVIIDSVYPPQIQGYEEQPMNGVRALEVLFAGCAADAACNAAFPDLRQVFLDTVTKLNETPLVLLDEEGNETGELWGNNLADEIFQLLYDTNSIPLLPAKIYAAAQGDGFMYEFISSDNLPVEDDGGAEADYVDLDSLSDDEYYEEWAAYMEYATVEELEEYLEGLDEADYFYAQSEFEAVVGGTNGYLGDGDSEGFFNTVECYEEVPFNTVEATEALSKDVPPALRSWVDSVADQIGECEIWDVPAASPMENEPVTTNIPTLVLSGEYDPITPPSWGQAAADDLPNARHFVIPSMGHGLVEVHPCPTQIALDFLADPAAELNTSCIAEMTPPEFVTEFGE